MGSAPLLFVESAQKSGKIIGKIVLLTNDLVLCYTLSIRIVTLWEALPLLRAKCVLSKEFFLFRRPKTLGGGEACAGAEKSQ